MFVYRAEAKMSKFKDWVMGAQDRTEEKRKLITDYMSKCPFIEFHSIVDLNEETATIDIAFDEEGEGDEYMSQGYEINEKEKMCMDCNEEKAVMIEHNVLHYCAKCMWKQQERNDKKREAWKNRL